MSDRINLTMKEGEIKDIMKSNNNSIHNCKQKTMFLCFLFVMMNADTETFNINVHFVNIGETVNCTLDGYMQTIQTQNLVGNESQISIICKLKNIIRQFDNRSSPIVLILSDLFYMHEFFRFIFLIKVQPFLFI